MKFSIKYKIAASFMLALFLALFFTFITFRNVQRLITHNEKDHHLQLLLKSLSEFDLSLIEIETNCRGYALAGKDEYLANYQKAVSTTQLKWANFKKLSANAPSTISAQDLLLIEKLLNRSIEYSNQVIKARQDFGIREATNIALTNRGFRIAEQILKKLNELENNQLAWFLDSDKLEVKEAYNTLVLVGILCLIMILILVIAYLLFSRDLSGRRKAEAKLKQINESLETTIKKRTIALSESEKKYRLLAENATDIVAMHDIDLRCNYVSDSVKSVLGFDPAELLGKLSFDFIHPDDLDYIKSRLTSMPHRIGVEFSQCRFQKKDGSYLWIEVAANFMYNEQGVISGMITNSRDISSRKNTEELLRKSQFLLQSVFNNTNNVIIIKDLEGHFLMVNKQFEKNQNTSIEKLFGKTVYDLFPADFADKITAFEKMTIESGKLIEQEDLIKHNADGSLHTYFSVKFPIVDDGGNMHSIGTISTDITEKKKYENELLESKSRLEAILENANSSIWSIDRNYTLTGSNYLHQKMFQEIYDLQAYLGMPVLEHLDSTTQVLWKEYYDRAFSKEHFSIETKEIIQDKEHYFDISFNPILNQDKVEGVSVFARDITTRKKTEQQLTYKVNELNTFMYRATHDLRSPLASVSGLVKLAKEENTSKELKTYFDMIDTSVNRMDKLLIDLFNITTITQGKLSLSTIEFESMIDEILESLSNRIDFEKIIFRKKIKKDSSLFHSDIRLLYSLLQNIIDNAIKYRRNSVLVESIVLIDISIVNNFARISITDNGIGIPAELQNKVFDMFYRATTESTGTGLGLYIAKTTAEKLGGEIRLKSDENIGTSVFIMLPDLAEE